MISGLQVDVESITNTDFKNDFYPLVINYEFNSTIFGDCLIATYKSKICWLSFNADKAISLAELKAKWPEAELTENLSRVSILPNHIFDNPQMNGSEISVFIKGTPFQIKVWKILLTIPFGAQISYTDIAKKLGNINAVRAVANCIAKNDISYIIPCHRVIKKSGDVHKYRWGNELKLAMLKWETNLSNKFM